MKVYGLTAMKPYGIQIDQPQHITQCRAIVAAKSKAAAVRALNAHGFGITLGFFNTYGAETGNDSEVAAAMQEPGRVYVTALNRATTFALVPFEREAGQ